MDTEGMQSFERSTGRPPPGTTTISWEWADQSTIMPDGLEVIVQDGQPVGSLTAKGPMRVRVS